MNTDFLSEAGEYFQDHFGFRQQLVTANALINGKIFGVSTADGVIQGKNGWLYYKDSLSDYLGTEPMSERALFNVAHTLSMMQDYTEKTGAKFLFTIAPNKNTLYGENMPYYDSMIVSEDKNMDRIEAYLEKENVNYVNLKEILESSDEVLYHERDSHWNNKGAALAGDALMTALDKEHTDYTQESYEECVDFTGDLDEMLYPLALTEEKEIYYDKADVFAYVGEVESNFDPKDHNGKSRQHGKSGDVPRFLWKCDPSVFCKQLCKRLLFQRYPLSDDRSCGAQADTVIVERAERFLPEMAENPPQMEAPQLTVGAVMEPEMEENARGTVTAEVQGDLVKVSGLVDEAILDTDSRIAIRRNGGDTFEAFPLTLGQEDGSSSDYGFLAYFAADSWMQDQEQIEVLIEKDGTWILVGTQSL